MKTFLIVLAFLAVAAQAKDCRLPFQISQGSNLAAVVGPCSCESCITYTTPGLEGSNVWTRVSLAPTSRVGAATSFHINVKETDKTSETKFTVMSQAILRTTNNGKSANWVYWTGRFNTVGPSKILKGTGPHAVTIVANTNDIAIYEDGGLVGTIPKSGSEITPTYHMQALTKGAVLDIEVTGIVATDGVADVYPPPAANFVF